MINIRKRGNYYQYRFEAGKVNGKREKVSKSGFKTRNETYIAVRNPMMNLLVEEVLQNAI